MKLKKIILLLSNCANYNDVIALHAILVLKLDRKGKEIRGCKVEK